ncbi:hypothetical protein J4420_04200 [Candidatus Woesearchaeota archaeon]|nr:hypothetical protein [Candidatus Woesearchaeota archaeon]
MRKKAIQFASLTLSALSLLYLLFVNLWRGDFMFSDWLVVAIDLAVKVIVEL